ncbi:hypothetical protein ACIF9R_23735 [Streptomyces sp. NPDC086080]|uniref:hypothetical protein n=1 Tax=Streptomyces sp. NPDC086080 TaxID=3365748 RepID=UPI0037D35370
MTTANWGSAAASRPVLPARSTALFLFLVSLLATIPAIGLALTAGAEAESRGTQLNPGSRTFLCRAEGTGILWSHAASPGARNMTVRYAVDHHTGSPDPEERAAYGHVISDPGGDSATPLPCRAG